MDFSELKDLIETLRPETMVDADAVSAQSAVPPQPDRRLALGWSRVSETQARLEMRVNRRDGWALQRARSLRETVRGEAAILIMDKASVTPKSHALRSEARDGLAPATALCLGASVGHTDGGPGSIGGFARTGDGRLVALSCHHVLRPNEAAETGDKIYHPGRGDVSRLLASRHHIGTLSEYVVLSKSHLNDVDLAYAALRENVTDLGNVLPSGLVPQELANKPITRLGSPDAEIYKGLTVGKIGRTTGYRTGTVNADQLVSGLTVNFPGSGDFLFGRVVEIRWNALNDPFSMDGDSGSLVFTVDERVGVGMHFAAVSMATDDETGETVGLSYAFPLDLATKDMGLTWLTT